MARFWEFCQVAVQWAEAGGLMGGYGGSILKAHAFRERELEIFQRRYGSLTTKKSPVHTLLWKESLLVGRYLRWHGVDIGELLHRNPRLRFAVPVRNPLDCARSNLRTHHYPLFGTLGEDPSLEAVLECVLQELIWARGLQRSFPDRVFFLSEYDYDVDAFRRFASFLELDRSEAWEEDIRAIYSVRERSPHAQELQALYRRIVEDGLADDADFRGALLRFID